MKLNGYQEAEKIDQQINELLANYPIDKENGLAWLNFSRTIKSGLEIIEEKSKQEMGIKRHGE